MADTSADISAASGGCVFRETVEAAVADDEELYRGHWSRVYAQDATQHAREWHCSTADALPFIAPYVAHAASRAAAATSAPTRTGERSEAEGAGGGRHRGLVVDVGCGSSSMGHDLWERFNFGHLLMTDIDDGGVIKIEKSDARS